MTYAAQRGSEVVHYCERPLPVGAQVEAVLDWQARLDHMHSKPSVQLMKIKKSLPQRDPYYFIARHFSYLGMAVWYMDDGCLDTDSSAMLISVKRFAKYPDRLQRICDALGQLGIVANFRKDGLIRINSSSSALIFEQIKTYIPECMQYKLPDKYKGYYIDFELHNNPQWQKEIMITVNLYIISMSFL